MAVKAWFAAAVALAITVGQALLLAHTLIDSKPYKIMAEPLPRYYAIVGWILPLIAIVATAAAMAATRRRVAFAPVVAAFLFPALSFLAVVAVVVLVSPVHLEISGDFGMNAAHADFAKQSAIVAILGGLPAGLTTAILQSVSVR